MSFLLIIGQATNATTGLVVGLVNTVIGIGGRGDSQSANVPAKLNDTVVPSGYVYDPIVYPASIQLSQSTAVSAPLVYKAVIARPDQKLIVAGYSEGTLAAEAAKRQLVKNNSGPTAADLSFLMIASPFAGNGGIFARFPGISVPFIVNNMGPAQASPYPTTYVINEYDPYADFPAYFNPIALINTLLAVEYAHPDQYYNAVVPGTTPAITTTVTNSAGGTDTYEFIHNNTLPLLAPLSAGAAALRLTPLVKPVLDAIEPLLRVVIDMAYTDRINAHPAAFTPFSLFTPLPRIISALAAVPGAISQGINNFINDVRTELTPAAATPSSALTPPPAMTTVSPTAVSSKSNTAKTPALKPVAAAVSPSPTQTSAQPPAAKTKPQPSLPKPVATTPAKQPSAGTGQTAGTVANPAPPRLRPAKDKPSGPSKVTAAKAA